jgi:GT2 family glycosyltransferase
MIVFGTAISDWTTYEEIGLLSIERVTEPDSLVLTRVGHNSIQRPYNEMMEEAVAQPDLEALVLLHQDLELTDDSLLRRIRPLFDDPRVGLVGLLGGRDLKPHLTWSTGSRFGTARVPGIIDRFHSTGSFEVEGVDGALLAIAPWVVRYIRFGEALTGSFHGYDADFSHRVRAAGGRVVCNDVPCIHHMGRSASWKDDSEVAIRSAKALSSAWDAELQPREWGPAFLL